MDQFSTPIPPLSPVERAALRELSDPLQREIGIAARVNTPAGVVFRQLVDSGLAEVYRDMPGHIWVRVTPIGYQALSHAEGSQI